ncbi:MAG: hypothetical protein DHS20C16_08080 [Phycisphaerae bacterium]|nr:MAG: hypothetical protein DHS20C16_08080 [Phycisphaerae bacterium]
MLRILFGSILLVSISVGCNVAVVPGGGTDQGNGDSDGGGGSGQGGTSSQITGPRIIASGATLGEMATFEGGISTYRIEGSLISSESDETLSPGMFLEGDPSCLTTTDELARLGINAAGELLVLARSAGDCEDPDSFFVNVYADATRLDGVQQPVRTAILEDPFDESDGAIEMAVDRQRDLLYVSSDDPQGSFDPQGDRTPKRIYVYEGISQASFDEIVSPVRTIILPFSSIVTLAIGTDDTLYVRDAVVSRITNASTRDGTLTENDFERENFGEIEDITVDSQNRLWMLRRNFQFGLGDTGSVLRVNDDFTDTDVDALISFAGIPNLLRIDSQGTAYVHAVGQVRTYANIESGSPDVGTTLSGITTLLSFEQGSPFILAE